MTPIRTLLTAVLTPVVALGALLVPTPAANAADPLPVPYNFLLSAVAGALTTDAPGTNDWSCKPSAQHPRPVVLVHGLTGNKSTNWATYGPLLKNNGYCVFALTYGVKGVPAPLNMFGGLNPMESSAQEVKAFVARVLSATGAAKVDIVGHSEGTIVPGYYVKFLGGAAEVHNLVSLAPIWHGTNPAGLNTLGQAGRPFGITGLVESALEPYFASGPQMLASSAYIAKLRSGGTTRAPGVQYTNIVTKYDELVLPYTSGIEPGATNVVLQDKCMLDFSEHFEIAADPVAAAVVLNALDPAHPRPVPCRLVLPFLGA
jgi:triacylglycerol lipase